MSRTQRQGQVGTSLTLRQLRKRLLQLSTEIDGRANHAILSPIVLHCPAPMLRASHDLRWVESAKDTTITFVALFCDLVRTICHVANLRAALAVATCHHTPAHRPCSKTQAAWCNDAHSATMYHNRLI